MNKTVLVDQPASRISRQRLRAIVTEFAEKANVYDLYDSAELLNLVRAVEPPAESESHHSDELQYYYALEIGAGESHYYR